MEPNRLPNLVYLTPCILMNYWVVLILIYLVLGLILHINYNHVLLLMIYLLFMIRSHYLIETWKTNRKHCYHKDVIGCS
jgi:hypothetical protein